MLECFMRQLKTYLFKVWNDSKSNAMWRASLENVQSTEKEHFASVKALLSFIKKSTVSESEMIIANRLE